MERLIDNALIYGAMFPVDDPYLIKRYNTALKGFGLTETKLEKFVIDAAGYSPEIAKECKNEDYLNPHGINRRFIILSPEQESLPVVYNQFSSTYDLMMAFFRKNAESLRTLTLKDVVFGEIENSTFRIETIDDILSIHEVEFNVRTGGRIFEKAGELRELLDRFFAEKNSWQNNDLMNQILERGNLVGDIRYNNIVPRHTRFQLPSFWTRHFEGIYVFREINDDVTIIGHPETPEFLSSNQHNFKYVSFEDSETVYAFLKNSGRIAGFEPDWLKSSGLVDLRSEILVRSAMGKTDKKTDLNTLNPSQVRNWIHQNLDELSQDGTFSFLTTVQKSLLNTSLPSLKNTTAALKLMILRANPAHHDRVLVARMLSQYAPFDFYTKFAVNKQAFYDDYAELEENLRDYVVNKITKNYFPNRKKYWENLFAEPED
ncbi:hypothetical protein MNBD_ALPHA08-1908 [hydrothermal vent metagenome]|uniref:Uncharacterized protein n=1 Tax=hydrothermal vent metagenome TaxID=652676 RepID=A0A3B0RJ55_9ZZZZ